MTEFLSLTGILVAVIVAAEDVAGVVVASAQTTALLAHLNLLHSPQNLP